ncbi:MAG: hypothetical protein F6K14_28005 [Symploca sp. SIO2C1]|nr:hypothetical protein [Symploca sp. SIO2C1]
MSQSDSRRFHKMDADHMQATVDTGFFSDLTAKSLLGGAGVENNLNWRYIWYALDRVVREETKADQLQFDMGKWSNDEQVKNPLKVF